MSDYCMVKFSIIIPVYNTEQYLSLCLNSCLDQDLLPTEYEIIAVNDGSTDGSLELLKDYENRYPNIHVFTQENKRQGAARNLGLKKAKGKYIWFVDSDDRIEPNCLKQILQFVEDSDISLFPGCWFEHNNGLNYSSYEVVRSQRFCDNFYRIASVGYIYSRSFLLDNNLYFLEGVVYEDNEFIPKTIFKAKKISYINIPVYYYFVRSSSTSHFLTKDKCLDLLYVATKICEYKYKHVTDQDWSKFFNKYIKSVLHTYLAHCAKFKRKEAISLLKIFSNSVQLQKEMYSFASIGVYIKMFLLKTSFNCLYFLLKLEMHISK